MRLTLDPLFSDSGWVTEETGAGSVTVSVEGADAVMTTTAIVGDKAYKTVGFAVEAGQTYMLSGDARILTNNGSDPAAHIFVDHPNFPSNKNAKILVTTDWQEYQLTFVVPEDHDPETDTMTVGMGIVTIADGSAEFTRPKLRAVELSGKGTGNEVAPMARSIWAKGTIEISAAGAVTIIDSTALISAVWQDGGGSVDSDLLINVRGVDSNVSNKPRPKAWGTTTGPDKYIAKASSSVTGGSNGQFNIKILDVTTGFYIQNDPDSTTRIAFEVSY